MNTAGLVKTHFLKNDDLSSLLIPDDAEALTATKGESARDALSPLHASARPSRTYERWPSGITDLCVVVEEEGAGWRRRRGPRRGVNENEKNGGAAPRAAARGPMRALTARPLRAGAPALHPQPPRRAKPRSCSTLS